MCSLTLYRGMVMRNTLLILTAVVLSACGKTESAVVDTAVVADSNKVEVLPTDTVRAKGDSTLGTMWK